LIGTALTGSAGETGMSLPYCRIKTNFASNGRNVTAVAGENLRACRYVFM